MFDMAPMGPLWWTIGLVVFVLLGVACPGLPCASAAPAPAFRLTAHAPSSSCVTISRTARSTTRTTCDGDQPWETDERVQESFSRWAWLVGISVTHDVCSCGQAVRLRLYEQATAGVRPGATVATGPMARCPLRRSTHRAMTETHSQR